MKVAKKRISVEAHERLKRSRKYMAGLIGHEKEFADEIRKIACRSNIMGMLRRREIGGLGV